MVKVDEYGKYGRIGHNNLKMGIGRTKVDRTQLDSLALESFKERDLWGSIFDLEDSAGVL